MNKKFFLGLLISASGYHCWFLGSEEGSISNVSFRNNDNNPVKHVTVSRKQVTVKPKAPSRENILDQLKKPLVTPRESAKPKDKNYKLPSYRDLYNSVITDSVFSSIVHKDPTLINHILINHPEFKSYSSAAKKQLVSLFEQMKDLAGQFQSLGWLQLSNKMGSLKQQEQHIAKTHGSSNSSTNVMLN